MAQLLEAWDVVQDDIRFEDAVPEETSVDYLRSPSDDECSLCGWAPAGPILVRQTVGMILFWRLRLAAYIACRTCARALYAEGQARSLVTGWWGIIAPVANVVNIIRNRAQLASHRRRVAAPLTRDPHVESLFDDPTLYRSPWTRPMSLLCTTVAVVALVALGSAWVRSTTASSPAPPVVFTPPAGVGRCVNAALFSVACTAADATLRLDVIVTDTQSCSAAGYPEALTARDGTIYCASPWPN